MDTIIKKLMQIKEGITVTVVCFQPDTENRDVGYDVTATGTVTVVDVPIKFEN